MATSDISAHTDVGTGPCDTRAAGVTAAKARHPSQGWRPLPRGGPSIRAPHTVDLRLLGVCQLRCPWCWGPEHFKTGKLTVPEWVTLVARLGARGTKQAVLSGGEPTLSKALRPVISEAKASGMAVTLSTNGIGLEHFEDVLCVIDDLGIPIDGSSPEANERMRTRSLSHHAWESAVEAILLAQRLRAEDRAALQVTVRTVIARPNLDDVAAIPAALRRAGVDLSEVRIKLYQVEPFGPHVGAINFKEEWAISPDEAEEAASHLARECPEATVALQLYDGTVGRYFLVDPDGNATGTGVDEAGAPLEVSYGNLVEDLDGTLAAYRRHQDTIESGDAA